LWIDDLFSATQNDIRRMMPKVTSSVQKYEKKGESVVQINEYSEVWVTSNQLCPLHMRPGSRRQLMIKASTLKLQDRAFFEKLDEEITDLDVGHAWFTFFKNMDLTGWSPQSNPEGDFRGTVVASCMVKSHIFITKFFVEDWYMLYVPEDASREFWTYGFELSMNKTQPNKNEYRLRMTQKRIYYLYKRFCKEFYSSSKTRDYETFWDEVAELGVIKHPKMRRIHEKQRNVCDIYFSKFKEAFQNLYTGVEFSTWSHEENPDEFLDNISKWEKY
jgi:hypothetical protein